MTKYEDERRVVARAITFIKNKILLIERYKNVDNELLHYYTIPGGGVEDGETYEETVIRETKEETCCDIKIIKYLGKEDYPNGRCYWYYAKYLSGNPTLGGEELIRNNPNNSYKVVLVDFDNLDKINILGMGKELIQKCFIDYNKNV